MAGAILTLNAGSSSLKVGLFAQSDAVDPVRIAFNEVDDAGATPVEAVLTWADHELGGEQLIAVGHRIVHGGLDFTTPTRLDAAALAKLDALSPLAPLHQPRNLAAVRAIAKARPDLLQVGVFDTAFHRGHLPVVDRFGLARQWEAQGLRRYGFHGLSYEYISRRMQALDPALAAGRMIVAHLGSGASLCAIEGGRSVDTTMGFSTLDGLVMATRSGSLDPGAILYLLQTHGLTAGALEDMLYRRSGLLGVSGVSADMRTLLASEDPHAAEAVELFVFRVVREIGALSASMGGVDGLVFTAGIGEHAPAIRERVCARLDWLGLSADPVLNQQGAARISPAGASKSVWAFATDEEAMIARGAAAVAAQCGAET